MQEPVCSSRFTNRQSIGAILLAMETVNFLLDRPVALLIVLAIGAFIGVAVERLSQKSDRERRKAYWRGRNANGVGKWGAGRKKIAAAERRQAQAGTGTGAMARRNPVDMAADQLKLVSQASFSARSLLNRSEAKVFDALDKAVIARNPKWQVMAQVSLGEFLASPNDDAFRAVNSKRVDFALMDENCRVVHALEYQGSGHHAGACAAARDAVKKEALRKAGIGYHEIVAGHTTPGDLRVLVERLVVKRADF